MTFVIMIVNTMCTNMRFIISANLPKLEYDKTKWQFVWLYQVLKIEYWISWNYLFWFWKEFTLLNIKSWRCILEEHTDLNNPRKLVTFLFGIIGKLQLYIINMYIISLINNTYYSVIQYLQLPHFIINHKIVRL